MVSPNIGFQYRLDGDCIISDNLQRFIKRQTSRCEYDEPTSCSTKRIVICAGIGTSRMAMCRRRVDLPTPLCVLQYHEGGCRSNERLTIATDETIAATMSKCKSSSRTAIYHVRLWSHPINDVMNIQDTIRTKIHVDWREVNVFALVLWRVGRLQGIDLLRYSLSMETLLLMADSPSWTSLRTFALGEHWLASVLCLVVETSLVSCVRPIAWNPRKDLPVVLSVFRFWPVMRELGCMYTYDIRVSAPSTWLLPFPVSWHRPEKLFKDDETSPVYKNRSSRTFPYW